MVTFQSGQTVLIILFSPISGQCFNAMAETASQIGQCFVCDKDLSQSSDRNALLLSNLTEYSRTGLPTKIGQLMGDGFMVVVTACDEACTRCYDLLNLLDKLEVDVDKVRRLLTSYLRKKYGLLESKYRSFGRNK